MKLETRYKKQEGEAPAAPILILHFGVFSFIVYCRFAVHMRYSLKIIYKYKV